MMKRKDQIRSKSLLVVFCCLILCPCFPPYYQTTERMVSDRTFPVKTIEQNFVTKTSFPSSTIAQISNTATPSFSTSINNPSEVYYAGGVINHQYLIINEFHGNGKPLYIQDIETGSARVFGSSHNYHNFLGWQNQGCELLFLDKYNRIVSVDLKGHI